MRILVVNSGSSSIKFAIFAADGETATAALDAGEAPRSLFSGQLSGVGGEAKLQLHPAGHDPVDAPVRAADAPDPAAGFHAVLDALTPQALGADLTLDSLTAVGYRVVHPGARLRGHQRVTDEVLHELEAAASFAPLHDPAVVSVIRAGLARFPQLPHFACFDTVFHETLPPEASTYPLPLALRDRGVRRYGFHGLSCESVVWQLRRSGSPVPPRTVIAHLGSGCSVTALEHGRSVDTSMGLTPDGGVVMGTRPGDLDPGLILYLLREQGGDEESASAAVEGMLNHYAGLVGLTGLANDLQAIRKAAAGGNADAVLALRIFTRSITKAIGSYAWLLGGLDAVVFTGGIGEHDIATRSEVLAGLQGLGITLSAERNAAHAKGPHTVSTDSSPTAVLVVAAEEELMIALHVAEMCAAANQTGTHPPVAQEKL